MEKDSVPQSPDLIDLGEDFGENDAEDEEEEDDGASVSQQHSDFKLPGFEFFESPHSSRHQLQQNQPKPQLQDQFQDQQDLNQRHLQSDQAAPVTTPQSSLSHKQNKHPGFLSSFRELSSGKSRKNGQNDKNNTNAPKSRNNNTTTDSKNGKNSIPKYSIANGIFQVQSELQNCFVQKAHPSSPSSSLSSLTSLASPLSLLSSPLPSSRHGARDNYEMGLGIGGNNGSVPTINPTAYSAVNSTVLSFSYPTDMYGVDIKMERFSVISNSKTKAASSNTSTSNSTSSNNSHHSTQTIHLAHNKDKSKNRSKNKKYATRGFFKTRTRQSSLHSIASLESLEPLLAGQMLKTPVLSDLSHYTGQRNETHAELYRTQKKLFDGNSRTYKHYSDDVDGNDYIFQQVPKVYNHADLLTRQIYQINASANRLKNHEKSVHVLVENQRGWFILGFPFFSANVLMPTDPEPWTCGATGSPATGDITCYHLPDPTWEWTWPSWYVDMARDVDDQGWSYSWRFCSDTWHGSHIWFHSFVRRRRWIRVCHRTIPKKVEKKVGNGVSAETGAAFVQSDVDIANNYTAMNLSAQTLSTVQTKYPLSPTSSLRSAVSRIVDSPKHEYQEHMLRNGRSETTSAAAEAAHQFGNKYFVVPPAGRITASLGSPRHQSVPASYGELNKQHPVKKVNAANTVDAIEGVDITNTFGYFNSPDIVDSRATQTQTHLYPLCQPTATKCKNPKVKEFDPNTKEFDSDSKNFGSTPETLLLEGFTHNLNKQMPDNHAPTKPLPNNHVLSKPLPNDPTNPNGLSFLQANKQSGQICEGHVGMQTDNNQTNNSSSGSNNNNKNVNQTDNNSGKFEANNSRIVGSSNNNNNKEEEEDKVEREPCLKKSGNGDSVETPSCSHTCVSVNDDGSGHSCIYSDSKLRVSSDFIHDWAESCVEGCCGCSFDAGAKTCRKSRNFRGVHKINDNNKNSSKSKNVTSAINAQRQRNDNSGHKKREQEVLDGREQAIQHILGELIWDLEAARLDRERLQIVKTVVCDLKNLRVLEKMNQRSVDRVPNSCIISSNKNSNNNCNHRHGSTSALKPTVNNKDLLNRNGFQEYGYHYRVLQTFTYLESKVHLVEYLRGEIEVRRQELEKMKKQQRVRKTRGFEKGLESYKEAKEQDGDSEAELKEIEGQYKHLSKYITELSTMERIESQIVGLQEYYKGPEEEDLEEEEEEEVDKSGSEYEDTIEEPDKSEIYSLYGSFHRGEGDNNSD